MTDWLLALVPTHGPWLLAVITFASCLAVPIPASVLMIAAGGFAAVGDLSLAAVAAGALAGAVTGDQAGFVLGRRGGTEMLARMGARTPPVGRAIALLARRGGLAVFLSRWLVSPLGPYVNLAAGASGMGWASFTVWGVAGEVAWVALYVGLGYAFAGNLAAATAQAGTILGFLAAGAVAAGLGWWLVATLRDEGALR